ncbi:MAG TPA: tyrosine-type recombinase/integrase [Gemmatimonadales bacterium]|nr:tyrosine-type recombinase/integrase [Gemmatimonadales bacterium]
MVFKMKGKSVYYGKLPTRTGWQNICLRTPDAETARAKQRMLDGFKHERQWAVLDALRAAKGSPTALGINEVYDAHRQNALDVLLHQAADVDLAPRVMDWQRAIQAKGTVTGATAKQYLTQVRTLIPADTPFLTSHATPGRMDAWLNRLEVASPTRRRYFAAAQSFFRYLIQVKTLARSPLADLDRPRDGEARADWWLPQADMQRLCESCHEPFRTLFALMYGTGIEVSVACGMRRKQVDTKRREIFAPGTKTHNRKRTVRVAEWAWPFIEAHLRGMLPEAPMFPGMQRGTARYQHERATERVDLQGYQLRDSRHSYAVRAAKAGTPPEIIARQLGHKDAVMVLKVYGRFFPRSEERDKWERIAAAQDEADRATRDATSGTTE